MAAIEQAVRLAYRTNGLYRGLFERQVLEFASVTAAE
jgi:hypothetical protein